MKDIRAKEKRVRFQDLEDKIMLQEKELELVEQQQTEARARTVELEETLKGMKCSSSAEVLALHENLKRQRSASQSSDDQESSYEQLDNDEQAKPYKSLALRRMAKLKSKISLVGGKRWLCDHCEKPYKTKKQLNRHTKGCLSDERKHVKIKESGEFPCRMCKQNFPSGSSYKYHVFYHHTDDETKGEFKMTVQKHIGKSPLSQIKKAFLGSLLRGELNERIFKDLRLSQKA